MGRVHILTYKEIGMRRKISMVFWCAAILKRDMTYKKAVAMASGFTIEELDRIYKVLKRRV